MNVAVPVPVPAAICTAVTPPVETVCTFSKRSLAGVVPPSAEPKTFIVSPTWYPVPGAAIADILYTPELTSMSKVAPVPDDTTPCAPPVYVPVLPFLPPVIAPFRLSVFPAIDVISNKRGGESRLLTAMPAVSPATLDSSIDVAPTRKLVATYL